MFLNRFFNRFNTSSVKNVLSDAGDIALYPISYKTITSLRDLVIINKSPLDGNCLYP